MCKAFFFFSRQPPNSNGTLQQMIKKNQYKTKYHVTQLFDKMEQNGKTHQKRPACPEYKLEENKYD